MLERIRITLVSAEHVIRIFGGGAAGASEKHPSFNKGRLLQQQDK